MYKILHLHDKELSRFNNKPYFRGTWETLRMERNRMLPFQIKTDGGALSAFQVVNGVETNITGRLNNLISVHSDYTTYAGGLFSDYLTEGRCYFKINGKYTEDVDIMDLSLRDKDPVGDNLITGWSNDSFDSFSSTGSIIDDAYAEAGGGQKVAYSNEFIVLKGQRLRVDFDITYNDSESITPLVYVWHISGNVFIPITSSSNTYSYTSEVSGVVALYVNNNSGYVDFEAVPAVYNLSDELDDAISADYIKITISSEVDFGGTYYRGGFKQVIWKNAAVEKGQGAQIEVIGDERNGVLVREKVTTGTKYRVKFKVNESEHSALIEAMPADWTITDTAGKIYTCYNKELSDPDWYNGNGIITLTFTDNISTFAFNNDEL